MDNKKKNIYAYSEAVMMVLIGVSGLILSVTDRYGLLMNEKFRWLTFSGSLLIGVIGVVALLKPGFRRGSNSLFFGMLLLIVVAGKPYIGDDQLSGPPESSLQAGLWKQIDQNLFPKMELNELSTTQAEQVFQTGSSFTTIGQVKRLETLEDKGSFALMSNLMYCCLADMIGTGLRVPSEDIEEFEDGQWVMISGKLVREEEVIQLPNFRFGRAMISSTNKDYFLLPEKIMTYDRIDQLPTLMEVISKGGKNQLFVEALEKSGMVKTLGEGQGYTIFLPAEQAMDKLDVPIKKMSKRELVRFVKAHIVKGKLFNKDLIGKKQLKSLGKKKLDVEVVNGKPMVQNSRILFKDMEARNGVVHYVYPAFKSTR